MKAQTKVGALIQMTRPANILTAIADIFAGMAIAGFFAMSFSWLPVVLLSLATAGLYAGGIVFNDVFDRELDAVERPERAIPRGIVSVKTASIFGGVLLATGCLLALFVNVYAGLMALLTAAAALIYNVWGKHHTILGPINMGLCRSFNLLVGMAIIPAAIFELGFLALVPLVYIAAVTTISRGEVHGSAKAPLYFSAFLYVLVINAIAYFASTRDEPNAMYFLVAFAIVILRPLLRAITFPTGPYIGRAVKAGVLALILMNAAWVAASGAWTIAIGVALLLPVSMLLARRYSVT